MAILNSPVVITCQSASYKTHLPFIMHQTIKTYYCLKRSTFKQLIKKQLIKASIIFFSLPIHTYAFAYTVDNNTETGKQLDNPGAIVVSIKPLYSLVAHLTEGISKPVLLMKQMQSPHHYNMRPSERRLLANARIIIWTGPQMESFLNKIIAEQVNSTTIVSAMQAKNLKLLNKRNLHSHDRDEHTSTTSSKKQGMVDPHIWLSTRNAIAISKHISEQLVRYNPENTEQYNKNLAALLSKIEQIKGFIKTNLKTHNEPFIAYHDAFQYFEDENALNYIDSINFNDETGTSLKHMRQIKTQIDKLNIQCLVYQAPKPAIIDALISQSSVKAVALDPLGVSVRDDKNAWFELMRQLTLNFSHCLSP